jgi:hypothetical protein
VTRPGVDQHVLQQVDIDGVGREAAELVYAVGELHHGA